MGQVVSVADFAKITQILKKQKKKTVLVGGCFDILHPGHVIFLEKAKKAGDILAVFLESDEKIKQLKGITRPVHTQTERAKVLIALQAVDYVILLPFMQSESDYDQLVRSINPDIIAVTRGQDYQHQRRVAMLVGAKLKCVTNIIGNYSTSKILSR